ncbi:MAG: hypothetical protein J6Z11_00785 [Candidatus Riflebacteria bacterium]|nr:hypothetical protein [Candidatus Riflebacteria bacterium]
MKHNTADIIVGYIFGLLLLLFGLMIIYGNAYIFYKSYIKKEKAPSIGFLLGSICSVIGIFILFPQKYWWIALIPVLLDYGGIYSLLYLIYLLILGIIYSTRSSK